MIAEKDGEINALSVNRCGVVVLNGRCPKILAEDHKHTGSNYDISAHNSSKSV